MKQTTFEQIARICFGQSTIVNYSTSNQGQSWLHLYPYMGYRDTFLAQIMMFVQLLGIKNPQQLSSIIMSDTTMKIGISGLTIEREKHITRYDAVHGMGVHPGPVGGWDIERKEKQMKQDRGKTEKDKVRKSTYTIENNPFYYTVDLTENQQEIVEDAIRVMRNYICCYPYNEEQLPKIENGRLLITNYALMLTMLMFASCRLTFEFTMPDDIALLVKQIRQATNYHGPYDPQERDGYSKVFCDVAHGMRSIPELCTAWEIEQKRLNKGKIDEAK